jgi:hypothetical protein
MPDAGRYFLKQALAAYFVPARHDQRQPSGIQRLASDQASTGSP